MITLTTDFGTSDYFVPAVKGVILSINSDAKIVDITNEIPAQDIAHAAFTLGACYRNFPAGTIHMAVVDPGVGSTRRAVVVEANDYLLVGPDNGIFSFIYSREERFRVFNITKSEMFRLPVSPTFHGRDIFAPVAAWLSRGISIESVGEEIQDFVTLPIPEVVSSDEGTKLTGSVIHIDRFGNLVTNFTDSHLDPAVFSHGVRMLIGMHEVRHFDSYFAQSSDAGGLFAYPGSAGYWEIGIWCGSAAEATQSGRGTKVVLIK